jgi:hypothetical protein
MPTLTFDPTEQYYVIIGCGFSAITNHVLLAQQVGGRLGRLTVLHIGSADPWRNYHPMPMGQWPTLLSLPGFHSGPTNMTRCDNLGSDEFADVNEREWNWLSANRPFSSVTAKVTGIRSSASAGYEIDLDNGNVAQAAYVDICGGPGPARGPSTAMGVHATLASEFQTGVTTSGGWPRLISGEMFLSRSALRPPRGSQVCVIGGGPTAAWCVEFAQSQGSKVLWLSQDKLNGAFVSSRRNDGLIATPVVRRVVNGNHVVDGNLRPSSATTVFGEGIDISGIAIGPSGQVLVSFQPSPAGSPRFTDYRGAIPGPASTVFDQVVLAIGQETDFKQPASWASLLKAVLAPAVTTGTHLIWDRQKRVVGLQSADMRVRVLGAAALSHPDVVPEWRTAGTPSNLFFLSLSEQARVPVGIALAAVTIAEANGFWSATTVNENLNTAGLSDLKQLTSSWLPGLDGAQTWFETRGSRVPPFELSEFADLRSRKSSY